MSPAQIGTELVFRLQISNPFVCNLVPLVAVVDLNNVTLFRELDAIFIGKFPEPPEHNSQTVRFAMMKTVGAAFGFHISNIQIRLSAKRLDGLIDNLLRLLSIPLISWNGLRRRSGWRVGVGWRVRAGWSCGSSILPES